MGVKKSGLMLTVLLVSCVSAAAQSEENVDRVFYFSHAGTAHEIRETYYIILGMTDMRPQFVDMERKTLTLRGTAAQIALAEWLFNELDKPSNPQLPAQRNAEMAKREFHLSGTPQQVARVFYPARAGTVQELTELATLLRAIIDMRSVFTYNASRAIVARGTPAQVQPPSGCSCS